MPSLVKGVGMMMRDASGWSNVRGDVFSDFLHAVNGTD
jgi:hypothetical protein